MAVHLGLVALGYWLLRGSAELWQRCLCVLLISHSIACLGFYAHDLSHKTILPSGRLLRWVETLVWTVVGVPATVWRRVHNATHHHETNTVGDPDRWFLETERSKTTKVYNRVFYPNREGIYANPLVGIHFIVYVLKHSWSAVVGLEFKPSFVTARPDYGRRQRITVIAEVVMIAVYQSCVIWYLGGWQGALWGCAAVYSAVSFFVLNYIVTNHALNDLCEHTDPVAGSTSVIVPGWLDFLHSNFSYHTEHHLFPGIDSYHYPQVCAVLRQLYPHRYLRLPLREAWRRIWRQKAFLE